MGQKNFDTEGKSGEQNRRSPAGAGFAPLFQCPAGQAPRRATPTQVQPAPLGFSPGDARGEAPCIRKLKISPFPEGGRGAGGWGQKNFDMAGKSGEQNRRAPAGCGFRPLFRCPAGQAPPPGNANAGSARATRIQPRGCKGRSPLHEITLDSPFPGGEERSASAGWGDGGQKSG